MQAALNKEVVTSPHLRDQVAEILAREISKDSFAAKKLPSVRLLSERFGVSSITIVGALEILEARKLIERVHGKGVFIRDKRGRSSKLGARTRQVGVFAFNAPEQLAEDTYYGEVLAGMVEAAGRAGDRITFVTLSEGKPVAQVKRALAETRMDGAVLLAWTDREALLHVQRSEIPFVLADHHFDSLRMDCVTLDSRQGSLDAVRHLYGLGHRSIGLLASRQIKNNPERYEGFMQGLAEAGLDPQGAIVCKEFSDHSGGYRAISERIAAGKPMPSAWFAWSGPMAAGALQALRDAQWKIPQDVSLVAAGSRTFARLYPGVTSTVADGGMLGAKVIELLDRRIENPGQAYELVQLPMPLVTRASSGTASRSAGEPK